MASELLSSKSVATAKCKTKKATGLAAETLVADGNGLYLRLRPTGSSYTIREWVFIYSNSSGKRRKLTLGGYPDHSLSDARDWARTQRQMIDKGIDPHEARKEERAAALQQSEKTLDALIQAYLSHLEKLGKPTREQRSIFKRHIPNDLLKRPASSIHKSEISSAVRSVLDKGLNRTADKLRVYLGAAYNAALTADSNPEASTELLHFGLESNPVTYVKRIPGGGSKTHDRILTAEELVRYFEGIALLPDSDGKDLLLMQLLLAGQRFRQLASAKVQKTDTLLEVVAIDSKGRRVSPRIHRVPLTGPALMLYQKRGKLFEFSDKTDIHSKTKTGRLTLICDQVSRWATDISDNLIESGKILTPFRADAVRRTSETWFMSQRYSRELVGQLLSHGMSGVQAKHYDRHDYRQEKVEMLERWHLYLLDLLPSELTYLKPKPVSDRVLEGSPTDLAYSTAGSDVDDSVTE